MIKNKGKLEEEVELKNWNPVTEQSDGRVTGSRVVRGLPAGTRLPPSTTANPPYSTHTPSHLETPYLLIPPT